MTDSMMSGSRRLPKARRKRACTYQAYLERCGVWAVVAREVCWSGVRVFVAYCTESYVKVWLPSEAASAGGSGLSDGMRHTTLLRERGITTAAAGAACSRSNVSVASRMGTQGGGRKQRAKIRRGKIRYL
jgi:hypothetical protein